MQRNVIKIVQSLCVAAGEIMEDASVGAVSILVDDPLGRHESLRRLEQNGNDIAALLAAAAALNRRAQGNE